jgi:hypothetical protein
LSPALENLCAGWHVSTRQAKPALRAAQEHPMMDLVVLALGLALFALAIGYSYACERL